MIKCFTTETFNNESVTIVIDRDIITDEVLHEINNYRSDSELRLLQSRGCIETAVVKLLANQALVFQITYNYNSYGVMNQFSREEGWLPMDGSKGILLLHVDEIEFDSTITSCDIMHSMPKPPKGNV